MIWQGKTVELALTGSHCTYAEVMPQIRRFVEAGARVIPIASHTLMTTDTCFGPSEAWQKQCQASEKMSGLMFYENVRDNT